MDRIDQIASGFSTAAAHLRVPGFGILTEPKSTTGNQVTKKAKAVKRLNKKSNGLIKQAEFYKAQGGAFHYDFMEAMKEYKATNNQINKLYDESEEDDMEGGLVDV